MTGNRGEREEFYYIFIDLYTSTLITFIVQEWKGIKGNNIQRILNFLFTKTSYSLNQSIYRQNQSRSPTSHMAFLLRGA